MCLARQTVFHESRNVQLMFAYIRHLRYSNKLTKTRTETIHFHMHAAIIFHAIIIETCNWHTFFYSNYELKQLCVIEFSVLNVSGLLFRHFDRLSRHWIQKNLTQLRKTSHNSEETTTYRVDCDAEFFNQLYRFESPKINISTETTTKTTIISAVADHSSTVHGCSRTVFPLLQLWRNSDEIIRRAVLNDHTHTHTDENLLTGGKQEFAYLASPAKLFDWMK